VAVLAPPTDLTGLSATELARGIRHGEVTSQEVVEAHNPVLGRADSKLNVLAHKRFEAARREAEEVDALVAEAAEPEGLQPLFGVPFTCKESIAVGQLSIPSLT